MRPVSRFPLVAPESSYNELTVLAAKEKTAELSFLAASGVSDRGGSLPETRVMGLPAGNHAGIGGCCPVTSTLVWGSEYRCDGMASGRLVGLDYAQNRYYASSYGRFATPDPAIGSAAPGNPQSWNRYSYVLNDPINSWDPQGLCSALIAGITQNPNTSSTDTSDQAQEFANEVGAITAFPYAGGSTLGGIANVVAQGMGIPTGATYTALQAIALAAQNPGPISIYAFSGGAAAFTSAWGYLTPDVQSRIQSVTYIDPGATTALQAGSGTVDVYDDISDRNNILVQLFGVGATGSIPLGAQFHDTGNCGHNWSCVFQNYAAQLSQNASNCQTGAGGVFGAPSRTAVQFTPSFNGLVPVNVYWWDIPPTPWVTSTIHYDLP